MKEFFGFIEYLFVDLLFIPFDFLRSLELGNWWIANSINFVLMITVSLALIYWTIQLIGFFKTGEEDKDPTAHSFL